MSCCGAVSPDASSIDRKIRREEIRAASHCEGESTLQTDFLVPGMHCIACIRKIETGLRAVPGVVDARANLSAKRVSVRWDDTIAEPCDIQNAFAELGFAATVFDLASAQHNDDKTGRNLLMCVAVAGFAAANIMLMSVSVWSGADSETAALFHLISALIALPAVAFAGQPFFRSAASALSVGRVNMDVPISLAVLLALAMSIYESLTGGHHAYFDAAVTLLFFLLIGRYLDHMMRQRARGALTRLIDMMPRGAIVVDDTGLGSFRVLHEIAIGDTVLVKPGERVPLDGEIIDGFSEADRSLVTGETQPVTLTAGTMIEAGALNLTGPIHIRVTRDAEHSFTGEVIKMMEAAEQSQIGYIRLADRAARIYAPLVHTLAAFTFLGWLYFTGEWQSSLYIAIAVLIITCPCALGLAVPIAQVVAASRLFRHGIMIKDGSALEKLCEADRVVFDKTGTLTENTLNVRAISANASAMGQRMAAKLASLSTHPAAQAVATHIGDQPQDHDGEPNARNRFEQVQEHPGYGIEAHQRGMHIRLGRRSWVDELSASGRRGTQAAAHDASAFAHTDNVEEHGSEICFGMVPSAASDEAQGNSVHGTPQFVEYISFSLSDTLREGAKPAVAWFEQRGYRPAILSGDAASVVTACAQTLSIPAERALGQQKPADKIAAIDALQTDNHKALYIGDGLNDAPALAQAHVSCAPSSGSDVGRTAADVVFTSGNLMILPELVSTALRTRQIIRQNFAIAIAYNCIAIPIAVAGHVTPLIAALAMSLSSIIVVANSLRLNLAPASDESRPQRAAPSVSQPRPSPMRPSTANEALS